VTSGNISKLLETLKAIKNKFVLFKKLNKVKVIEKVVYSILMEKVCSKCKVSKSVDLFGMLTSSKDGLRFDCNDCRKEYRKNASAQIKEKQHLYYNNNKQILTEKNKEYRAKNKEEITQQRKEYRNRDEVKQHIKLKQKEYLPIRKKKIKERRKTDLNFKLSEILRSKIHKMLNNRDKSHSNYVGCDLSWLKAWFEFRFDDKMNWENFGSYWQIDHILPINRFDFKNEIEQKICFHWTNLQPLSSLENRQKSNKLILHYYFNNIINVNRFNSKYKQFIGYQVVSESLQWLREKLRYGKNPMDENEVINSFEIGNQQPSL